LPNGSILLVGRKWFFGTALSEPKRRSRAVLNKLPDLALADRRASKQQHHSEIGLNLKGRENLVSYDTGLMMILKTEEKIEPP
jgi:hypothetical protein